MELAGFGIFSHMRSWVEAARTAKMRRAYSLVRRVLGVQNRLRDKGAPGKPRRRPRSASSPRIAGRVYEDLRQGMDESMLELLMWARINRENRQK